ncbi:MAG: HlyC/CorC family transporter, partial [Chloroflexaceae bacterium]|nr:HlyC/CorC family transporter [Chloroflexaceae bacterium]
MDPDPSQIVLLIASFMVLAFASAADAAFTSVNWRRISSLLADRAERSPRLARLTEDPYRFKATIILLNTGATIVAAAEVLYISRTAPLWMQGLLLFALLLLILVVSAALPKAIVMRNPQAWVQSLAGPISLLAWGLWPVVAIVNILLRPFGFLLGRDQITSTPLVIEEELRMLMEAGDEEDNKPEELRLIESVFDLNETEVHEIMVPRVDMVALEIDTPLHEALDAVISEGHSRIPLYEEIIDSIVGILYAKDLLPELRNGRHSTTLKELARPVYFVSENVKLDSLLKDMQQSKVQMAIIRDEFGGTAGLVTIEDLVEQIVGDIHDEYDDEPNIQVLSDRELVVLANTPIDDINEMTTLDWQSSDVERVGGLLYETLGRVPNISDVVELPGATVEVLSLKGQRPGKLRIVLHDSSTLRVPRPA